MPYLKFWQCHSHYQLRLISMMKILYVHAIPELARSENQLKLFKNSPTRWVSVIDIDKRVDRILTEVAIKKSMNRTYSVSYSVSCATVGELWILGHNSTRTFRNQNPTTRTFTWWLLDGRHPMTCAIYMFAEHTEIQFQLHCRHAPIVWQLVSVCHADIGLAGSNVDIHANVDCIGLQHQVAFNVSANNWRRANAVINVGRHQKFIAVRWWFWLQL